MEHLFEIILTADTKAIKQKRLQTNTSAEDWYPEVVDKWLCSCKCVVLPTSSLKKLALNVNNT